MIEFTQFYHETSSGNIYIVQAYKTCYGYNLCKRFLTQFVLETARQAANSQAGGQPRPTGIGPQPLPIRGADMGHAADDKETMRLRARAGGWNIEISRKRALEEAFGSMWVCQGHANSGVLDIYGVECKICCSFG